MRIPLAWGWLSTEQDKIVASGHEVLIVCGYDDGRAPTGLLYEEVDN